MERYDIHKIIGVKHKNNNRIVAELIIQSFSTGTLSTRIFEFDNEEEWLRDKERGYIEGIFTAPLFMFDEGE